MRPLLLPTLASPPPLTLSGPLPSIFFRPTDAALRFPSPLAADIDEGGPPSPPTETFDPAPVALSLLLARLLAAVEALPPLVAAEGDAGAGVRKGRRTGTDGSMCMAPRRTAAAHGPFGAGGGAVGVVAEEGTEGGAEEVDRAGVEVLVLVLVAVEDVGEEEEEDVVEVEVEVGGLSTREPVNVGGGREASGFVSDSPDFFPKPPSLSRRESSAFAGTIGATSEPPLARVRPALPSFFSTMGEGRVGSVLGLTWETALSRPTVGMCEATGRGAACGSLSSLPSPSPSLSALAFSFPPASPNAPGAGRLESGGKLSWVRLISTGAGVTTSGAAICCCCCCPFFLFFPFLDVTGAAVLPSPPVGPVPFPPIPAPAPLPPPSPFAPPRRPLITTPFFPSGPVRGAAVNDEGAAGMLPPLPPPRWAGSAVPCAGCGGWPGVPPAPRCAPCCE